MHALRLTKLHCSMWHHRYSSFHGNAKQNLVLISLNLCGMVKVGSGSGTSNLAWKRNTFRRLKCNKWNFRAQKLRRHAGGWKSSIILIQVMMMEFRIDSIVGAGYLRYLSSCHELLIMIYLATVLTVTTFTHFTGTKVTYDNLLIMESWFRFLTMIPKCQLTWNAS
jgi:hypothetical protein